jgi:DNA repair exonuclease SbcCD ATPase subunit
MIVFDKVKYSNFMSTGENAIEVDLSSSSTTLVVGKNGSGKSSLAEAISFALYGKSLRGINKPQLINSVNGKGTLVELYFRVDGKPYMIRRGLKPNLFEIWSGNEMINQDSNVRDYQGFLENNILKMNFKSFGQIVVLGSSSFVPFMQLSSWHRRQVIEDLLDIGVFTKMNAILKDEQSQARLRAAELVGKIEGVKTSIDMQTKHVKKMVSIENAQAKKLQDDINLFVSRKNVLIAENDKELSSSTPADMNKLDADNRLYQARLDKLVAHRAAANTRLQHVNTEESFFKKHASCPTCMTPLSDEVRNSHIKKCEATKFEINGQLETIAQMRSEVNSYITDLKKKLKESVERNNRIANRLKSISEIDQDIARLNGIMQHPIAHSDVDKAKSELDKLISLENDLLRQSATESDDRSYNAVIAELLKDSGIKTMIIKQYLPVMNKLINHYLQILDFFVSFTLDENFNETIKSRHLDEFSYASFSEGERMRIDLALLFVWRQVAKMKNSSMTNLLILDETFDSALDSDGIDNLLKILETFSADTNVFVISHRSDALEGKFKSRIEFSKVKNFTEMQKS